MKPVSAQDYYQVRRCYGGAEIDLAALTDFYLPLVGSDSFAAYMALNREGDQPSSHGGIFSLLGLTPGEFELAINRLEAVGLIRTFCQTDAKVSLFVYCLYAPLHAKEFAGDIMLSGTLRGKLGETEFDRLYSRHQGEPAMEDMEEISVSFPEVFKPIYDAKYYLSSAKPASNDGKAAVRTGFDRALFLRQLEGLGTRKGALSDVEIENIDKIATLYSLPESTIAELVYNHIVPNAPVGKKVNFSALSRTAEQAAQFPYLNQEKPATSKSNRFSSASAPEVRKMDEYSPARYLSELQKNKKPASSDLKLVDRLMREIGLSAPCTNALLVYVLTTKNNTLPSAYCEKLAAAMVREGCETARDALDYLDRTRRKKKTSNDYFKASNDDSSQTESKQSSISEPEEHDVTDEELEAALKRYYGERK